MGIASMAWVARIPEIKDAVGLSNGQFGFIFLGATIGAVLGAQVAGRAIHTFGSRPVINLSSFLLPAGLVAMAFATTALELFLALLVMGFGYALTDMSVNTQAVVVEKILDQKWMSSFHGMWSVGSFLVTVFGGIMIAFMTPKENLIWVGVVSFLAFIPANIYLLSPAEDEHAGGGEEVTEAKIPFFGKSVLPLWAIGLGLIAGMVAEGAASDWGAILLRDNMNIPKGIYASAFASFALAMITSRFLGDKALEKFGPRNTVRYGGMYGGAGWAICLAIAIPLSSVATIPALLIANIGFIFAGLGIGPMFPAFILAASRLKGIAPAVAISRVGVIGIAGFFIGPTFTGLIAEATSLSWAMAYPIGMMVLGGYMSRSISED
ncbi:MAG: MFS transporter [Actinobacteria bacterium]|nr:MFS transporter [Actinomycetota bacterium]